MKKAINFITAELFLLYTFYQVIMLTATEANPINKLIGIVIFSLITTGSFMMLSVNPVIQFVRMILFVAGLTLDFVLKLISAGMVFSTMFYNIPSVLDGIAYVLSEGAVLFLLLYYIFCRHGLLSAQRIDPSVNRRISIILLTMVIVMFMLRLLIDCLLVIKYRVHIDLSAKATLLSRFLYCFAFVGTALGFFLSLPPKPEEPVAPEQVPKKNPALGEVNKDFIV